MIIFFLNNMIRIRIETLIDWNVANKTMIMELLLEKVFDQLKDGMLNFGIFFMVINELPFLSKI